MKKSALKTLCGLERFGVAGEACTQTTPHLSSLEGRSGFEDVEESSAEQSGWLVTQKAEASPPSALQFVQTITH